MPLPFTGGTGDTSTGWRPAGGAAPLQPPQGGNPNQDFLARLARRRGLQKAVGQETGQPQPGQAGGNMANPGAGPSAFPARPGVTDMPSPGRPTAQPPTSFPSPISMPAPKPIAPQQTLQPLQPPTPQPQGHIPGSNSGLPAARRDKLRQRGIAQGQSGW